MYRLHFWLHTVRVIGMPGWLQMYRYEPLHLDWPQLVYLFEQLPKLYSLLFSAGNTSLDLETSTNLNKISDVIDFLIVQLSKQNETDNKV